MDTQSMAIVQVVLFLVGSLVCTALSWRSLRKPGCHGFYRFFAFETILLLVILNAPFWFHQRYAPWQLVSWFLLFVSLFFVGQGFYLLRKKGGHSQRQNDSANFAFENTAYLVTDGIYRHVRHPLYSSLLLFAWGVFCKHITPASFTAAMSATVFLFATAKVEERENLQFFGSCYQDYMAKSRMFIHYLL